MSNSQLVIAVSIAAAASLSPLAYAQKAASAETPQTAAARAYPDKPVRVIVGLAPGGATDIVARAVAQRLSDKTGKSFIVDNRSGAGGSIAATLVAKATPDGYTLLTVSAGYTIAAALYEKLPFDPHKDLVPVSRLADSPFLLVVNPALAAKNLKELIAMAKAKPGQINFAHAGNGSSGHMTSEVFKIMAGIRTNDVPYKGANPAMVDVIAGQVDMVMANILGALPYVRSGKLRALAVTSSKRSAVAPEIPSIAEAGVPGYNVVSWYGILAPAGTPAAIVRKLNREIGGIMMSPAMKEWLQQDGAEPVDTTPEEFGEFIATEIARWRKVVREGGLRVQ